MRPDVGPPAGKDIAWAVEDATCTGVLLPRVLFTLCARASGLVRPVSQRQLEEGQGNKQGCDGGESHKLQHRDISAVAWWTSARGTGGLFTIEVEGANRALETRFWV